MNTSRAHDALDALWAGNESAAHPAQLPEQINVDPSTQIPAVENYPEVEGYDSLFEVGPQAGLNAYIALMRREVIKRRTRRLSTLLTLYFCFFSFPSPVWNSAYAVTTEQIEVKTAFSQLTDFDAVREELAQRAANVINLNKPWPNGEARFGGLTERQAQSVLIIAQTFGEKQFDYAVRVAWCESRLNPESINRANGNRTVDRGLFMLNDGGTMQRLGVNTREVFDARANAEAALILFEDRGWQPWVCAKLLGFDNITKNGVRRER